MQRPSRDTLLQLAKDDPEAIVDLVYKLFDMVESLQGKVEELEAKVSALQKNSRNSSKPPSSDLHNSSPPGKGKKKSGKGKEGRKPGGQKGHKGSTLRKVANPDHIVGHHVKGACPGGQDPQMGHIPACLPTVALRAVAESLGDLFSGRPSPGTISNILESAGTNAAPTAARIKEQTRSAEYIHLDETSLNLGGKKYWLYTS